MAIYLGQSGLVTLTRTGVGAFNSLMDPGDVNPPERRFSFDFPDGTFITGDRVKITRLNEDGTNSDLPLDFVDAQGWSGTVYPDGTWYVNVDPVGGIRLYHRWDQSLTGERSLAVPLNLPSTSYRIKAELQTAIPHCVGQVTDYSLVTSRDAADVTVLGEQFEQRISTLISGGGDMNCFWDWRPSACGLNNVEMSHYFHQLILRQQLGSEFKAEFFIKTDGAEPIDEELDGLALRTALFYSVNCIVTNVSMAFSPTQPLVSQIRFATTGEIKLQYGTPTAYLILQEDGGKLLLQDGSGALAQEADV